MPRRGEHIRLLGAMVIGVLGTCGVIGLSLGMNAQVDKKKQDVATIVEAVVASTPPRTQGPTRKARTSVVKKGRSSAPAPGAALAAGLPGLDFGLGGGGGVDLSGATDALLESVGTAVMNEDAVEVPPQAVDRSPPAYPSRARSQGVTGKVTLSFVVDVDGSVQDLHVVEAVPPGVFDDAARDAVRSWRFQPGQDGGVPVAVRVRQTLRFELE